MPETTGAAHAANLKAARKESLKRSAKETKQAFSDAISAGSILSYISPFIDWLFGIALILAIFKDILDIIDTALIAAGGIGEILIIMLTFFISSFIFLIMFITGSVGKVNMAKSIIKKLILLIGTSVAEIIPLIGLLPLESFMVMVVFWMTLAERKKSAQQEN